MPKLVHTLPMKKKSDNPTSEEGNDVHTSHQSCQLSKKTSKDIFLVIDNICFYLAGHCGMPAMDCQ